MFAWLILLTVIGSLVYSAYSKLNPDALIAALNTEVQKNYPGSNLNIAKVNYGFSIDFKLSLKELTLTRGQTVLATAKEFQLKVPWWLILLNRGHASINISDLTVFISSETSEPKRGDSPSRPTEAAAGIEMSIPQYLVEAHYTLRAKNISIKELYGDRRYFTLAKLLVREFQYGKNSAFELNIPISISHQNRNFTSELWLFGDITPEPDLWSINYRGEFKTKENLDGFEFDDLVIDGKSTLNPVIFNLVSQIELLIEKKKVGSGVITAKQDQVKVELSLSKFPVHFMNILGDEIKNPFWKKIEGSGVGSLLFTKNLAKNNSASIVAKLNFPGVFSIQGSANVQGMWFLDFKNGIWETSFQSDKHDLKFSRRSVLNFSKGQVSQYSQEIGFTGRDFYQSLFVVESMESVLSSGPHPLHSTVVLCKKCLIEEKEMDASFRYGVFPSQKYYQAEIQTNNSNLSLNYSNKASGKDFVLELNNFQWSPDYKFLGQVASANSGIVSGKVEGKWEGRWQEGTWLMKLSAKNLEAPSGDFFELQNHAWDIFNLDQSGANAKSWQASVNKNMIKISPLVLSGSDPAHLNGTLFSGGNSKSYLTLTYPANKKWKPVKKEIIEKFWEKEIP
jgi:hypothetical protein